MFQGLRLGLESLLFPADCAGCGIPLEANLSLCSACREKLPLCLPPWCQGCGLSLAGSGAGVLFCRACLKTRPFFDAAVCPFLYDGAPRRMLLEFKYGGRLDRALFFAEAMAAAVRRRLGEDPADCLVPVPLHPTRLRERGFNQAERLARALSGLLGLACEEPLFRSEATAPQADLPADLRRRNVRTAFALEPAPALRRIRILLVDDILTSGATASACARLLKRGGARSVTVVAAARG